MADRITEIDQQIEKIKSSPILQRLGKVDEKVVPLLEERARLVEARAEGDAQIEKMRRMSEEYAAHDGTMSSYGLDLARRSLDRTDATPRPRDPWTCPSCGGPTSVKNAHCGEC